MSGQNGVVDPRKMPPDLELLLSSLTGCIRKDGSVKTDHYLCALTELHRLFSSMGKGLGLSLHGVPAALKSLEIQRVSGARCYYDNLTLMLEYEAENRLQRSGGRLKSGTDSLLLLHRAFSFMLAFLTEVARAVRTDTPFPASHRVKIYNEMMSQFHPAWVRGTVKVLLLRSPGRQEWSRRLRPLLPRSSPATPYPGTPTPPGTPPGISPGTDAQPAELLNDIVNRASPVMELTSELFKNILLRGD